jgi:hypothetical protein
VSVLLISSLVGLVGVWGVGGGVDRSMAAAMTTQGKQTKCSATTKHINTVHNIIALEHNHIKTQIGLTRYYKTTNKQ